MPSGSRAAARIDSLVETRKRILTAARDIVLRAAGERPDRALRGARRGGDRQRPPLLRSSRCSSRTCSPPSPSTRSGSCIRSSTARHGLEAAERRRPRVRAARPEEPAPRLCADRRACEPEIDVTWIIPRRSTEIMRVLRQGIASGEFVDQTRPARLLRDGRLTGHRGPGARAEGRRAPPSAWLPRSRSCARGWSRSAPRAREAMNTTRQHIRFCTEPTGRGSPTPRRDERAAGERRTG